MFVSCGWEGVDTWMFKFSGCLSSISQKTSNHRSCVCVYACVESAGARERPPIPPPMIMIRVVACVESFCSTAPPPPPCIPLFLLLNINVSRDLALPFGIAGAHLRQTHVCVCVLEGACVRLCVCVRVNMREHAHMFENAYTHMINT